MRRVLSCTLYVFLALASALSAQEGLSRGRIKKVDADTGIVIVTVDGKDRVLVVTDNSHFLDATQKDLTDRLKDKSLKEGATVVFKAESKNGKQVLIGMKLVGDELSVSRPSGEAGIRRARIRKIDFDKMVVTLAADGKDKEYLLTDRTVVHNIEGKDRQDRLKNLKAGTEVLFRVGQKDGKDVLLDIGTPGAGARPRPLLQKVDTSKLKALNELGSEDYHGYKGGFYPDGKNQRPDAHEKAGLELAKKVQPLGADGKPNPKGKIVLLSVGMSNTWQSSEGFRRQLAGKRDISPHFVFVNGAQAG